MLGALGLGALVHSHDLRGFGGALDEQNGGQYHADLDCDGEVHGDGQGKGRQKDGAVADGHLRRRVKLCHSPM